MNLVDVLCRMNPEERITVRNFKNGESIIENDSVERIFAFADIDADLHRVVKTANLNIINIAVDKTLGNIVLSVIE